MSETLTGSKLPTDKYLIDFYSFILKISNQFKRVSRYVTTDELLEFGLQTSYV